MSPLMVKDVDFVDILEMRATLTNGWFITALDWHEDTDFGYVPDNLNFWFDGGSSASEEQLKLRFEDGSEILDIHEGDKVLIAYDTYYYIDVILPQINVDGTELFVGLNGNTYADLSLCNIAKGSLTPTPTPTPIPTASPTPSPSPTPTCGPPEKLVIESGDELGVGPA